MAPYQTIPTIHPTLPPMRLTNRRTLEHVGPCPFCGGDPHHSDRFHVWLEPGKERYWCRACNERGPLRKLLGDDHPLPRIALHRPRHQRRAVAPAHADAVYYRELYAAVTCWAHANLLDEANPEPRSYLHQRGLDDETIRANVLGVTRRDPDALADYLRHEHAALLPYAEAAGVLVTDPTGAMRAHPNLCGCLVFPYLVGSTVVDLRTRTYPGKGYRSLAGGYSERGATSLFGGNALHQTDTVIITEGEIKALVTTQAYRDGHLSTPAIAHPGLSYMREEWGAELLAQGVRTVILAYDSQPRPVKDGTLQLAPEEIWTIRHGQRLEAAGLDVRVLRLPLVGTATKADLDEFILAHGPVRLQHLIDTAPALRTYHHSLPRHLLQQAKLPTSSAYPLRRGRPRRISEATSTTPADTAQSERIVAPGEVLPMGCRIRCTMSTGTVYVIEPDSAPVAPVAPTALSLDEARSQIAALVQNHASTGKGFLVLAHPPGTGKGHNTVAGLRAYRTTAETPGQIVWTALRKEQIHDQTGLSLIALHGRNPDNCRRFPEAQALAARGYPVRETLCQHRCPLVGNCAYLRQFRQAADFFAPQPLLQATDWWQEAGVVVLDEFNAAQLTRIVPLDSANLARIAQRTDDPAAQTVLRWLSALLGTASDRTLAGSLLLTELDTLARTEGLDLETTLHAALAALPPEEEQLLLPGVPHGASLADYAALPPNYLATLLRQLDREYWRHRSGQRFTSRLEMSGGYLRLFLRIEHLIQQLARPEQPKLILDATANVALLQAIFPTTPMQVERPRIVGGATVVQVITRDWAKSTLHGDRREQWYDEVAAHIRPERPTLVVCTLACESDLRAALEARGHTNVTVAHYGALRGSNDYNGFDVLLAQVYHPNRESLIQQGRALFADDHAPLDERMITEDRLLTDASGATWSVDVAAFADTRLAALLEQSREAEMEQAALRGRPFDHPEAQITLLFGLPLPNLPPTAIREGADGAPTSNRAREATAREILATAAQQLLDHGQRVVSVDDLATATGQSVTTVRKHMPALAGRLSLRLSQQRRLVSLPKGGQRAYERAVLVRRGRWVPSQAERATSLSLEGRGVTETTDHARTTDFLMCVICGRLPHPGCVKNRCYARRARRRQCQCRGGVLGRPRRR